MPKVNPKEKEDRCLNLWLLANRDHPDWAIEKIYLDILCEEFEGRTHEFRAFECSAWPKKQQRSLSWFTQRIANQWKGQKLPMEPEETIVKPWGSYWGNEPARIRILSVLFDLASEVRGERVEWVIATRNIRKMPLDSYPFVDVSDFQGFPGSVCDWAYKLSDFFDLENRNQCLLLIHFAHVFANDERYAKAFDIPMSIQSAASKMLMRWHKRVQQPDLTTKMFEKEDWVSIPLWEQDNWGNLEWLVGQELNPRFSLVATMPEFYIDEDE